MTTEHHVEPRELLTNEREILAVVLGAHSFPGADQVTRQIRHTSVTGGLTTFLDLAVSAKATAADVPDRPVPGRALVCSPAGEIEGEIIVWLKHGYLAGLEFAWYTDDPPTAMPELIQIHRQ